MLLHSSTLESSSGVKDADDGLKEDDKSVFCAGFFPFGMGVSFLPRKLY